MAAAAVVVRCDQGAQNVAIRDPGGWVTSSSLMHFRRKQCHLRDMSYH